MPRAKALARIDQLLASLDLPEKDKLTGEFSKGMKRKTAIARALLHDSHLLILDAPNSGLDPLTSFFIINYLKTLKHEGKTILLSAHNLFRVETICDRVGIIKNGKLLVFDTMDSIRARLGKREYQVIFHAEQKLDYELVNGNYTQSGHKLRLFSGRKAQFVTVGIIYLPHRRSGRHRRDVGNRLC